MQKALFIVIVAIATLSLGACATTSNLSRGVPLVQGPAIQNVTGPYDAAKACVKGIPETASINIGVGAVRDVTGRMSVVGNGNGSFLPIVATKMMESSLADTGVKLVDMSNTYRELVDWYSQKGLLKGAKLFIPDYLVEGTISSLDFLPGKAASFHIAGVGYNSRTYQAIGRGDFSLSTFPFGAAAGGYMVATTKVSKEFTAIENGGGTYEFVGGGTGARFASFSLDKGEREPMQYTVGYMTDYAAVDLVTTLLQTLVSEGKIPHPHLTMTKIDECRQLLEDTGNSPAPKAK
ncbi:MAG: hypothetical protein ACYCPH_01015 [Minisyncoccota bacterium]